MTPRGEWRTPVLFGVLDDHSRLVCHLQWYQSESAENIAHGLSQAMLTQLPAFPPNFEVDHAVRFG
jgi:putative transposase